MKLDILAVLFILAIVYALGATLGVYSACKGMGYDSITVGSKTECYNAETP